MFCFMIFVGFLAVFCVGCTDFHTKRCLAARFWARTKFWKIMISGPPSAWTPIGAFLSSTLLMVPMSQSVEHSPFLKLHFMKSADSSIHLKVAMRQSGEHSHFLEVALTENANSPILLVVAMCQSVEHSYFLEAALTENANSLIHFIS